jgi:hypothetical protein
LDWTNRDRKVDLLLSEGYQLLTDSTFAEFEPQRFCAAELSKDLKENRGAEGGKEADSQLPNDAVPCVSDFRLQPRKFASEPRSSLGKDLPSRSEPKSARVPLH